MAPANMAPQPATTRLMLARVGKLALARQSVGAAVSSILFLLFVWVWWINNPAAKTELAASQWLAERRLSHND